MVLCVGMLIRPSDVQNAIASFYERASCGQSFVMRFASFLRGLPTSVVRLLGAVSLVGEVGVLLLLLFVVE